MKVSVRLPRGEWFFDDEKPLGPPGGFGEVFAGQDPNGKPVAVKRLKVSAAQAAHRELTIAQDIAGKEYRHVLAPLDSGQDANSGGYFIVMPRADRSLADHLSERGPIPEKESVDILAEIAAGLEEIPHLVHRDLKPGNVLYHEGAWKLADFGIARFVEEATSANTVKGFLSPQFAAPEQWNEEHATAATDVYALCCVGYALLTGEPPFPGPNQADYRRQHLSDAPRVLDKADPRLRAILSAGLRKPQPGRPLISRVRVVLAEIAVNPPGEPSSGAALRAINAAEAERKSKGAAEAERQRLEHEARQALVKSGEEILKGVLSQMAANAAGHMSEAGVRSTATNIVITIGTAHLSAQFEGLVPSGSFSYSNWRPVAIGRIGVVQAEPPWEHGATLWYMTLRHRWYEVSYRRNALTGGPLLGPFAIQEADRDMYRIADAAAGPGMSVIEVQSGPEPIDDEHTEKFVQRWLERLALAYQGRLRGF